MGLSAAAIALVALVLAALVSRSAGGPYPVYRESDFGPSTRDLEERIDDEQEELSSE